MKFQGFKANRVAPFKNDCTVRALASASGQDYYVVFCLLKLAGRQDNSGFDISSWMRRNGNQVLGKSFVPVTWLDQWGTFLCWNGGHAWAVVNGILHDHGYSNLRAKQIFQVLDDNAPEKPELTRAKALAKAMFYLD